MEILNAHARKAFTEMLDDPAPKIATVPGNLDGSDVVYVKNCLRHSLF
jgi:hypothetical protein